MNEGGDYDRASRGGIKLGPEEVLRWAVIGLPSELMFTRWIDTRTIPFPGEADRVCDTVAELHYRDGLGVPWALVAEAQTRPDANFTERVVEYAARFRLELRHGPHRRDRYNVGAVLIRLTGAAPHLPVDMRLAGTAIQLFWNYAVMPVADESAEATLQKIAAETLGRVILCWVPLMRGGTEPTNIAEWLRLAGLEPDDDRRRMIGAIAITFAELTDNPAAWRKALEGWGVEKSPLWEKFRKEERQDNFRVIVMELLDKWFDPVPREVREQVQLQTNVEVLERWARKGIRVNSQEEMRELLEST